MRLLVDNSVSGDLTKVGHDSVHIADYRMASAPDPQVYKRAAAERRVIITQDADFGPIHAAAPQPGVGIVLLRMADGRPSSQSQVLADNLPALEEMLVAGAVVVIEDEFIRIQQPVRT